MYIISRRLVNQSIEDFVRKKFTNKDGVKINTVLEEDKEFVMQFLNRYYKAFEKLIKNKKLASYIFIDRLKRIDIVRFNEINKDIYPVKFAFEDMEETCEGKLEGGLFFPSINHGVILLDMDFLAKSKEEGLHTLIHELTHAMTLREDVNDCGKRIYKNGLCENGRAFYRLNEGITELISQELWNDMYVNKHCPGIGRYALEVEAAKKVVEQFGAKSLFMEDYIVNSNSIEDQMKIMCNHKGKSLFEFIKNFNNCDFGNSEIQNKFAKEIMDYNQYNFENNIN